jgi:hypothetical protein
MVSSEYKYVGKLDVVVQAYSPSTPEAEAGRSIVQGQHGLRSETLFKKKKKKSQIFLF